jgi:hypothetical protein
MSQLSRRYCDGAIEINLNVNIRGKCNTKRVNEDEKKEEGLAKQAELTSDDGSGSPSIVINFNVNAIIEPDEDIEPADPIRG